MDDASELPELPHLCCLEAEVNYTWVGDQTRFTAKGILRDWAQEYS